MCVCVCVCMYIYMYVCICICICIFSSAYLHITTVGCSYESSARRKSIYSWVFMRVVYLDVS